MQQGDEAPELACQQWAMAAVLRHPVTHGWHNVEVNEGLRATVAVMCLRCVDGRTRSVSASDSLLQAGKATV